MASVAVPTIGTVPTAPAATVNNSSKLIGSDGLAGVYWRGSDGNLYTQNNLGQVVNQGQGAGAGVLAPNANATISGLSYREIADPNAPSSSSSGSSGGGTTGNTTSVTGGSTYTGPSAAQTDPLLASLGSLDTILTNKNQASTDEYNRAIAGYDAQDALDKQAYDQNTHQNEQNLTAGNQAAVLNAANASNGLRAVLASLGALGGSGNDVVNRLVGLAANSDLGNTRQTFDTNATNLSQAWNQTSQEEKQRRDDANATLQNNLQDNNASVLGSKQSIYEQLANLYGAGTSQGDSYASQASALAAPIAATTRATVAPYASASSLFSPSALQTYLAGTQNLNTTTTAGDTPINSPTYALTNTKKDTLAGVA